MPNTTSNYLEIPINKKDITNLDDAIYQAPNPLFESANDFFNQFPQYIYKTIQNYQNNPDKHKYQVAYNDLRKSINTLSIEDESNDNLDYFEDLIPVESSRFDSYHEIEDPNLPKPKKKQSFIDEHDFDKTIKLNFEPAVFEALINYFNFNHDQMLNTFSLYFHLMATNHTVDAKSVKNKFTNDGQFHYLIGRKKGSILNRKSILSAFGLNSENNFNSFAFENGFNPNTSLNEDDSLSLTYFDLNAPIQTYQNRIINNYFFRLSNIRMLITNASVKMLYKNPSHQTPNPKELSAYDYWNLLNADIIIHGHIKTYEMNLQSQIEKYEDTLMVTNFLKSQFNYLKWKYQFGFATDILFNFGEKLDKETQNYLRHHHNDTTIFKLEKSTANTKLYTMDNLAEMDVYTIKKLILRHFSINQMPIFRQFMRNHPQWVK